MGTCDHCKAHFEKMHREPITDRAVVLIRIPEPGDTPENEVTLLKPEAIILELPPLPRGYGGLTTPVTFELNDIFEISDVQEHTE